MKASNESKLAFHGDAKLRDRMLAEVKRHIEAEAVVGGTYGKLSKNDVGFKGCFIGCTVHAFNPELRNFGSVELVEQAYNFDWRLTRICEAIFESLEFTARQKFFLDVVESASIGMEKGVNVRLVHWKFLSDTVERALSMADEATRSECEQAIGVVKVLAGGKEASGNEVKNSIVSSMDAYRKSNRDYINSRSAYIAYASVRCVSSSYYNHAADASYAPVCMDDFNAERKRQWKTLCSLLRGDKTVESEKKGGEQK